MLVSIHLGATPVLFGASFGFCRGIPGCSQKPLGLHRDCQNDCSRNFAGQWRSFSSRRTSQQAGIFIHGMPASGLDDRSLESGANWSAPAIAYGQYFGWFNEDEWNEPSAPITREFAAQLLVNAFFPEAVGTSEAIHFQDENDITSSRLPYVQAAVKLGLISGYADGTFLPQIRTNPGRRCCTVIPQPATRRTGIWPKDSNPSFDVS